MHAPTFALLAASLALALPLSAAAHDVTLHADACPNPTVGPEWCPPDSRTPVYLRVCYAHVDATCDLLP